MVISTRLTAMNKQGAPNFMPDNRVWDIRVKQERLLIYPTGFPASASGKYCTVTSGITATLALSP
jgi:hypothetical protein